jgi:hypothetical protein
MATPKRKRNPTRPIPNKRPKVVDAIDASDGELSSSDELWAAESILDEKRSGRKLQYLVEWKGIDPRTGDTYPPTWEPEKNCTPALVDEWKSKKAARRGSAGAARSAQKSSTPRQRTKKSRVVESSPEHSTAHSTTAQSTTAPTTPRPLSPARESAVPAPSSAVTTPAPADRPSPKIHIGPPTNSFDPAEYERYSQLAASQLAASQLAASQHQPTTAPQSQETDLDSSQLFTAVPEYRSSGIVPDSESSGGEESFVPATQQTTATTQHSSTANESQEDVTEDSVRVPSCPNRMPSLLTRIHRACLKSSSRLRHARRHLLSLFQRPCTIS